MKAFDQAIAFGMIEGRATVRDAEPRQRIQEAGGGELRAVVGVESKPMLTRALRHHVSAPKDCGSNHVAVCAA